MNNQKVSPYQNSFIMLLDSQMTDEQQRALEESLAVAKQLEEEELKQAE